MMVKFQQTEDAVCLKIFNLYSKHISHDSPNEKNATFVFEVVMVTHAKWLKYFSW